jgi:hypothetical protein
VEKSRGAGRDGTGRAGLQTGGTETETGTGQQAALGQGRAGPWQGGLHPKIEREKAVRREGGSEGAQ